MAKHLSVSVLPNVLTVARIIAIVPLVWLILEAQYLWALGVAIAAGISDALDGHLARRYSWQSHFGGWADPAADKLMMTASYLTLTYIGVLPVWLMALVIGRDMIIATGALVYRAMFGQFRAMPTWLSKITTLAQVALIWLALIHLAGWRGFASLSEFLILLVGALTAMTLIQYVMIWGSKAWLNKKRASEIR